MTKIVVGILIGAVGLGLARFAAAPPSDHIVHHHANWAVYINGQRLDLSADRYMEDVEACVAGENIQPRQRVHLHNNEDHVVHVHHDGVAWGHLFTNLGFALGPDYLVDDRGNVYRDGEGGRLTFVVNGFVVASLHDRLIRPGDRALIAFGELPPESVVETLFPSVASDAAEYDASLDPGACGGAAPHETSLRDRLRAAFWW